MQYVGWKECSWPRFPQWESELSWVPSLQFDKVTTMLQCLYPVGDFLQMEGRMYFFLPVFPSALLFLRDSLCCLGATFQRALWAEGSNSGNCSCLWTLSKKPKHLAPIWITCENQRKEGGELWASWRKDKIEMEAVCLKGLHMCYYNTPYIRPILSSPCCWWAGEG